ncbi:nickel ABC transporter substrate-binding protein [Novosphingobium marinum]|uniref:Nickel ABC transporter substrate-binding protein n=1 Tax=Novosphingobium marinum TaxID=1514948 RepID=A0A7Y9XYS0_9SPHN|nr:DUF4198 domain-containing protein [Novosphingobium marinum]NYH97109.1 hypothetical protein [Novosphingobium marinum]GGC43685.1 nickel ABC transporter substrate-binding protein [Novosphingobium marinum]
MRSRLTRKKKLLIISVAGAICAISSGASAHSIWFAERAGHTALIYGVGADDLDAVKRLDKIEQVAGYDDAWQPVDITIEPNGVVPVVDSDEPVNMVAATMDYGSWAKTPDGKWHTASRLEHPDAVVAEHNWKYAVHIKKLGAKPVPLIPGHTLQLVPVANVFPQSMGNPIVLRAIYEGKPQEGVEILTDYVNDPDQLPLVTGSDGTITFPVRNQGLNVVTAIYRAEPDNPAAFDHIEHRATLSFVLPHKPE